MDEAALAAMDLIEFNAAHAVEAYTSWYFTSAITFMVVSLALMLSGMYLLLKTRDDKWDIESDTRDIVRVLSCVIIFITAVMFAAYVPTAVEPEARAISGLIKDIRG